MTTDAVGPDPATVAAPPAGKPRRREIRTDDGRVFRVGVEVLYHASEGPDYPLWAAQVKDILNTSRGEPVLVLRLDDPEGIRLPDASEVHLDGRPLASCRWCDANQAHDGHEVDEAAPGRHGAIR